ncbi:endosome-associated-trafficking regulator 1 isoform X2 [Megalops cyprinoides]|uniref:endosome-associated-trafficking regulator 1 isoform X2 n=1 Tax=Megalops cyprinoides TaxID=118141 RepID=UPI001864BCA1|nr:endosome-associated-trafficking regulator 1 isoform X2 [Megalops cyprinoides]
MSKQTSSGKILINEDGKHQDVDELNPFSFKEFMRSKNQSSIPHNDGEGEKSYVTLKTCDSTFVAEDCSSPMSFDLDFQKPFIMDPALFPQSLDNDTEEKWSGSYQPSAVEKAHEFELYGTLDNSELTNLSSVSTKEEKLTGALWQLDREKVCQPKRNARSNDEDWETSSTDVLYQTTQCSFKNESRDQRKLIEENAQLRNHIIELLKKSESDDQRIRHLKEELHKRSMQEVKEVQTLETMVQSVEQNLQLMTKRAVKAENIVSKLKQEAHQLQDQLEECRSENERLRAAETATLNAVKQNAQVASEYLNRVANSAKSSVRQLLTETETLCLISQMLFSIDKISEVHTEHR